MNDLRPGQKPVAVVTGGSQGFGLAVAESLARDGWALVIDARRVDRLEAAVERLRSHTEVAGVAGDVADPVQLEQEAPAAAAHVEELRAGRQRKRPDHVAENPAPRPKPVVLFLCLEKRALEAGVHARERLATAARA